MESVAYAAEFDIGYILKVKHVAVFIGADYDVVKFFRCYEAALVTHDVLEALITLLAECTGSGFDILLGKCGRYIGRHQVILCHYIGLEPYTHRVVGTHYHCVTNSLYTLDLRNDVDFYIVLDEVFGIGAVLVVYGKAEKH